VTSQSNDTGRRGGVAGGVILIGIGMLALTGWWWPGIMLVIGCGLAAERLLRGEFVQAIGALALFLAIPLDAWCELSGKDLRGRCPFARVGLLPDPEGKGTDSSWSMWTPSSPDFTLRWTTSATPSRQPRSQVREHPCVRARSSPWPSSLGGAASLASGTSTATRRALCAALFLPCRIARSSTAWCAPTRNSSSVSSCTWSLCAGGAKTSSLRSFG